MLSSLIPHNNNEPLHGTETCWQKWILYDSTWPQPSGWLSSILHLPRTNLRQKRGHSHHRPCPSDPLKLSESYETITSEKYAQEIKMHQNRNACSRHWPTERFSSSQQQHSKTARHTIKVKVNKLVLSSGLILQIHLTSCQSTTTFQDSNLCRDNASIIRRTENAFQEFIKSWSGRFCHRNKQTHFWQVYRVDCNG